MSLWRGRERHDCHGASAGSPWADFLGTDNQAEKEKEMHLLQWLKFYDIDLINVLDTGSNSELKSVIMSPPDLQTLEALLWPLHHGVQEAEENDNLDRTLLSDLTSSKKTWNLQVLRWSAFFACFYLQVSVSRCSIATFLFQLYFLVSSLFYLLWQLS